MGSHSCKIFVEVLPELARYTTPGSRPAVQGCKVGQTWKTRPTQSASKAGSIVICVDIEVDDASWDYPTIPVKIDADQPSQSAVTATVRRKVKSTAAEEVFGG